MYIVMICLLMVVITIISYFWDLLKTLLATIFWVFVQIWKSIAVDGPMKKSGFKQQKELEQKMINAQYTQKCHDQLTHQQNRIVSAGINKVCELRAQYSNADEQLFQTLLRHYPILSVEEVSRLELEIKKSHTNNI